MQIDMFGSGPKGNFDKFGRIDTKAKYYLAKSALQKCVRRGMVEHALRHAWYMECFSEGSVRKRLPVIAVEDIGLADTDLVAMVIERAAKKGGYTSASIETMVSKMAMSEKCRDIDDIHIIKACSKKRRPPSVVEADPVFNSVELNRFGSGSGGSLDWFGNLLVKNRTRIGDVFASVGSQLAFGEYARQPRHSIAHVCNNLFLDKDEVWPSSALDGHVWHGRMFMEREANARGEWPGDVALTLFLNEGCQCDKRIIFGIDYKETLRAWVNDFMGDGVASLVQNYMDFGRARAFAIMQ